MYMKKMYELACDYLYIFYIQAINADTTSPI